MTQTIEPGDLLSIQGSRDEPLLGVCDSIDPKTNRVWADWNRVGYISWCYVDECTIVDKNVYDLAEIS